MRIMSNNQWKWDQNLPNWEARGEDCSAEAREKGFAKIYKEIQPDIIGLQEVSPTMLEELMCDLQELGMNYTALWGKDTPILYKSALFTVEDQSFALYPEQCPGYSGCFNNVRTKSWNMAIIREKNSGKAFLMTTTHLWWMSDDPNNVHYQKGSEAARCYQMKLVTEKMETLQSQYNCPAVLVGDMNCPYHSEPIELAFQRGFVHANDTATEYAYPYNGYHWCGPDGYVPYEPKPFEEAIDHILVRADSRKNMPVVRRFDRYVGKDYLPLSDHFPAWIDMDL